MQKLSYRDQIIITFVLVILIGVVSYMFLIKPKYESIKSTQASLEAAQAEWNDLETKINQIDSIKERIQKKYDECVELGNFFVDVKRANTLEKFIQSYIDKNGIYIKSRASFTDPSLTTLAPYTLDERRLDYNIGQSANLEISAEDGEENSEGSGAIESQSLPFGTTTIDFTTTRERLMQFMQELRESKKTIEIKSLSMNGYTMDPAAEVSGNLSIDVYYAAMISDLDIAAEIAASEKAE